MTFYPKSDRAVDKKLNASIRKRDSNTCQLCKKKKPARGLQIHHIFKWATAYDLRFDADNLICLCKKCHKEVTGHEESYANMFLEIIKNAKKKK